VNYSNNFCEGDSGSGGDSGKFSYVDYDDNDHYSPIRFFDRCVMKPDCLTPTQQITSLIYT
jgi:hypothetical protein